jgi:hypothetical protein
VVPKFCCARESRCRCHRCLPEVAGSVAFDSGEDDVSGTRGRHLEQLLVVGIGTLALLVGDLPTRALGISDGGGGDVRFDAAGMYERYVHRVAGRKHLGTKRFGEAAYRELGGAKALIDAWAMSPFKLEMFTTCPYPDSIRWGRNSLVP